MLCALIADPIGSDAIDQLIGIVGVSDYGGAAGSDGLITGRTRGVGEW